MSWAAHCAELGRLGSHGQDESVESHLRQWDRPKPAAADLPETSQCRRVIFLSTNSIPRAGNLTLLLGTAGLKVNVAGNLLLSGNVLFPLTDAGLRSRVTTVVGMDYAF